MLEVAVCIFTASVEYAAHSRLAVHMLQLTWHVNDGVSVHLGGFSPPPPEPREPVLPLLPKSFVPPTPPPVLDPNCPVLLLLPKSLVPPTLPPAGQHKCSIKAAQNGEVKNRIACQPVGAHETDLFDVTTHLMCSVGDRGDQTSGWVLCRTKTTAESEYTLYSTVLHMVLHRTKTIADREIYALNALYNSILQLKQTHTPTCLNRADERSHTATARSFIGWIIPSKKRTGAVETTTEVALILIEALAHVALSSGFGHVAGLATSAHRAPGFLLDLQCTSDY